MKYSDNDLKLIEAKAKDIFDNQFHKDIGCWMGLVDAPYSIEFWWDDEKLIATSYHENDVTCEKPDSISSWTARDFQ